MIEKEIIVGVERGGNPVSRLEIGQMAGRCGRSYEKSGEVVCVVPSRMADYAEDCLQRPSVPVTSKLSGNSLLFHVLPMLMERGTSSVEDLDNWFSRSLCFVHKPVQPNWGKLLQDWWDIGAVVGDGNSIRVTEEGRVSVDNYIRPEHVAIMREKLKADPGGDSLVVAAWLLSFDFVYSDSEDHPELDEFLSDSYSEGLFFDNDEQIEAFAIYRCFFPSRPKWVRSACRSLMRELDRRLNALEKLALVNGKDISGRTGLWRLQLTRRVPRELYPLLKSFPDASIPVLAELESFNVRTARDLNNDKLAYASLNLRKHLNGRKTSKT